VKTLYLDCFSGISGDMLLGALIDAGAPEAELRQALGTLECAKEFVLTLNKTEKQGITGTDADVLIGEKLHAYQHEQGLEHTACPCGEHSHEHPHDHAHSHSGRTGYHAIAGLIDRSGLSQTVKERAKRVFYTLARAEAQVHGTTIEEVHFHEVGAVDSIVDICSAAICLELLGIERIICSPMNLGGGTVRCAHGLLPVPAPATALILCGKPCYGGTAEDGELVTPTGASIAAALADEFGPMPGMNVQKVGYGFGKRPGANGRLNALRVMIGETAPKQESMQLLQANLDDVTGEELAFAIEQLLQAGAADAYVQPITMKKGRPAYMLCALCREDRRKKVEEAFFLHTPTLGVRYFEIRRSCLERKIVERQTPYGIVRVKQALEEGKVLREKAEYDDCARIAREQGISLRAARAAAEQK
jgi:uncharacterized protein (TIGR00299 family) protein